MRQLVEEAQELLARGLRRAYVRREEALASPRGRIDFQAMAGRGSLVEANLPCVHHRRDQDRLDQPGPAGGRAAGRLGGRRPGAEGQGTASRRRAGGDHRPDPARPSSLPKAGGRDGPDDQALRARRLAHPHPARGRWPVPRRGGGRADPARLPLRHEPVLPGPPGEVSLATTSRSTRSVRRSSSRGCSPTCPAGTPATARLRPPARTSWCRRGRRPWRSWMRSTGTSGRSRCPGTCSTSLRSMR